MDQDKSRFEEQRKDLDQSPEKDGAIRYEMKNVDEVPRKSIREAIAEQSNDNSQKKVITKEIKEAVEYLKMEDFPNKDQSIDQKQNKEFLDKEKSAYLFDAEEISIINKDLNQMNNNPYGDGEELSPEYLKFLEDNQGTLEKVFEEGYDNEKLVTAFITFENIKDSSVQRLKIVENTDNVIKEKIAKQITGITSELANQKGLSKIWTIKEKFGIDEDKNITEEEAFHKESQKVDDKFYKDYRIFKEDYKYTIPVSCPLCRGNKLFNLLIFKIKCPRCHGIGSIQVDPAIYYKRLKSDLAKNKEVKEKRVTTVNQNPMKSY